MSVGCLKDGRWICNYYIDGKPKREYFGRGLEGEKGAKERDAELKTQGEIRNYTHHTSEMSGITFETLAMEYLKVKAAGDLATSTINAMTYKLISIILPELGHLQAAGITHKRLDTYVENRLSTPRTVTKGTVKKPIHKTLKKQDGSIKYVSRSTVHRELCDIQAILNWAVTRRYLLSNPVRGHKKPKKDNAILKPPTVQETQTILKESAPHLIRALQISFFTGLRPGAEELFRLTWNDVDFKAATVFIVSAKKNGLPFRTVPVHPELLRNMKIWAKEDQINKTKHLITFKGQPIKSIKSAYTAAKRRAGITRRIRMYDFRHAAITNMLADGADLKSVSQIAGHSRTDTTTKIYQHTNPELLRLQINRIPSLEVSPPGNTGKQDEDI